LTGLTDVTVEGNTYAWESFDAVVMSSSGGRVTIHLDTSMYTRHVHVYRNRKLVVKWDLDNKKPMVGVAPRKLLDLIRDLETEGRL